jgi:hypothetical protein
MIFAPFAYKEQKVSGGAPLDPDASTYLAAVTTAGGTYTSTQETAVNNLFTSLKATPSGVGTLYTKLIAMYPMVGGTGASHAINGKTPGTFDMTLFGGWTHTTSGMTANGSNSYANTNIGIDTDVPFPDAHYSFRQTQTSPANSGWDGYYNPGEGKVFGCNLNTGGQVSLGLWFLSGSLGTLPDYTEVITGLRPTADVGYLYRNGTLFYTDSNTRTQFTTNRYYYIGAMNDSSANYYNNNIYNFYTLGYAIPTTDMGSWSTIWNTYITEMGR